MNKLRRSAGDRWLAGICGGLGQFFGIDSNWFRLLFAILFAGGGSGLLIYLILWIAVPVE